jgi:hypothetical protein
MPAGREAESGDDVSGPDFEMRSSGRGRNEDEDGESELDLDELDGESDYGTHSEDSEHGPKRKKKNGADVLARHRSVSTYASLISRC